MVQTSLTETLRQSIISVLGAPPDPAPLHPQLLAVASEDGYRREHVKYQVSPNEWGYAYLLVPDSLRTAAPVIYCHHDRNYKAGKAEVVGLEGDKKNAIGVELVRLGFVVFAPDALGYGERRSPQSFGAENDRDYNFFQHALLLLRGETLLRKMLWDISRGIDYLETRTEIDSRFIGFVGQGHSGKMALWAAALEPRIQAAVAHGGLMSYRAHVQHNQWLDVEYIVPRLMQVADLHHILSLTAPRPFLLSYIEGDPLSVDAAEIYQRALPEYQKYSGTNRLTLYRYPSGQGFERHMRFNVYTWLCGWLLPY